MHREHEDQGRSEQKGAGDGTTRSANAVSGSDSGKSHLIGDALRSVYRRTLEEDIPSDFLDLLNKLK